MRRQFKKLVAASVTIQTAARTFSRRLAFMEMKSSTIKVQCLFRQVLARARLGKAFWERRQLESTCAAKIQSLARGVASRKYFAVAKSSAIRIQAFARRNIVRCRFNGIRMCATRISSFLRAQCARIHFSRLRAAAIIAQSAHRKRSQSRAYKLFLSAAVLLQAAMRGKYHRRRHKKIVVGVTRTQASVRRHVQRMRYTRMKEAALRIQCHHRCIVSKTTVKNLRLTVTVQRCARRWLAMCFYAKARAACVQIQTMARQRKSKEWYRNLKKLSTSLASLSRRRLQMMKYSAYRKANLKLQTFFRGEAAKKILRALQREQCLDIAERRGRQRAAKTIQFAYRAYLHYRAQISASRIIQKHVRDFFEKLRRKRILKSLLVAQAFWRGALARKRSSKSLKAMRQRVRRANSNAREEMKLGNRTSKALSVLLNSSNLSEVFIAIKTLEVSTRLSSVCCICFVENNAVPIIYGLMRSCNRSQPHRKLLKHALHVLISVWPFEIRRKELSPAFFDRFEVLVDLIQMFRDKTPTFRLVCRLGRWLCSAPERALKAAKDKDIMKRLRGVHAVLSRKSKINSSRMARKQKNASTVGVNAIAALLHQIEDTGNVK